MRNSLFLAIMLPRLAMTQENLTEDGLPRAPHLHSFEKGTQAGLALGISPLYGGDDVAVALEYALEVDFEVGEGMAVEFVAPAGTLAGGGNSKTVFGNVGLGFRGATSGPFGAGRWLAGGGLRLWLPTATEGDPDDLEDLLAGAFALAYLDFFHPMDLGRFAPFSTTIRPTGSAAMIVGNFVGQMEMGFDVLVPSLTPDGSSMDTMALLHLGFAPGMLVGTTAYYLSFATSFAIAGEGTSLSNSASMLALGVRSVGPTYTAGVALNLPLDPFDPSDAIGFLASVGGRF